MNEFRVTKYDPALRDAGGPFRAPQWTSVSDIGSILGGRLITVSEYVAVEDSYVLAVRRFMQAAAVTTLEVTSLEASSRVNPAGLPFPAKLAAMRARLKNGLQLSVDDVGVVVRLNLRNLVWCRLQGHGFFVHFGYDYYMYIGCSAPGLDATEIPVGLFAESFRSPYHPEEDELT